MARINNLDYAGGTLLYGALLGAVGIGMFTAGVVNGVIPLLIMGPLLLLGAGIYVAFKRPVLWIEAGDRFHYRTLLSIQSEDWSDVTIAFEDETSTAWGVPIGCHRVIAIGLRGSRKIRVKVTHKNNDQLKLFPFENDS